MPGGFSDLCVVKSGCLQEVTGIDEELSCLLEPISCCIKAIKKCRLSGHENVLILGSGFTGIIMSKLLSDAGHNVSVLDRKNVCLEKALLAGASFTYTSLEDVEDSFGLIIDTTASTKLLQDCIGLIDSSGKLLLFGVCPENSSIKVDPHNLWKKEIQIISSRSTGHDHTNALEFLKKNDISFIITHKLSLDDMLELGKVTDETYVKGIICL